MGYINTTNFKFTAVREQVPSVNDWAATYWNWISLDRIMYGFITHKHDGSAALSNPIGNLSLSYSTQGGSLLAGKTYYFVATLIDFKGCETSISTEASITMPAAISTPPTPTYNSAVDLVPLSGGLTGGSYWYKISYLKGGGETLPSNAVYIQIPTNTTYKVTIHFTSINQAGNNASAIRVYRKIGVSGSYNKIADITDTSATSFTDTGSNAGLSCDVHPASVNTTNSSNKITIDCANITNLDDAVGINIYVSTVSGLYSNSACKIPNPNGTSNYTIDLTNATPVYTVEYTGQALSAGSPPAVSQTYPNPDKINLATEVQGYLSWDNMPYGFSWRESAADIDELLEITADTDGEARIVLDIPAIFIWNENLATPTWSRVSIIQQPPIADENPATPSLESTNAKINEILSALRSAGVISS